MLTPTVTPGKVWIPGELVDYDGLNLTARPNITLDGLIGNSDLSPGAVQPNVAKPGAYFYAAIGGAINAYTLTLDPALASLANGAIVYGKPGASLTNTGAATLNVNGTGAKSILRNGNVPLRAGDIRDNQIYAFQYTTEGTGAWIVLNPIDSEIRQGTNNGSTGTAYNFTTAPTLTALIEGAVVAVEIPVTNTGAATLVIDGLTAKAIRKLNDQALVAGELQLGAHELFRYDANANSSAGAWILITEAFREADAVGASSRNLYATLPSVTQITVTADEVILRDAAGNTFRASSVSETAAITASGANGLDTGAEAPSTWYYLWLIYNGASLDALLSASATAPTLPSGYTYKALVAAAFNNSGSNFEDWMEFGEHKRFYGGERAVPANAASVTIAHNLVRVPWLMRWVLVCKTAEFNFVAGDEVPFESTVTAVNNPNQEFYCVADATNVRATRSSADVISIVDRTDGTLKTLTDANWRVKVYASL